MLKENMGKRSMPFFILTFVYMVGASASAFSARDLSFPTPVDGLSWTFYNTSCPTLESIVRERIEFYLNQDITQAAGLLRLHFHDCFVQGCDGSVLLNGTTSERVDPPNVSLRAMAFTIINDIKARVEAACSGIVSCADILTLAARDSVNKAGGPFYPLPLGRRDSLTFANLTTVLANLPSPSSNVTGLMSVLSLKGLNFTDLVALSGGHTIGRANCSSFDNRLYDSTTGENEQDPTLDQTFAKQLYLTCPTNTTVNTTNLDIRSPNVFDNKYYVDLLNRQTLFTSDQTLYSDSRTRSVVTNFAVNQTSFFEQFVLSMLKMGQLDVLTGSQGEIRENCEVANPTSSVFSILNPQVSSSSYST
ncbi:peroxidase 12 [Cryptomeria japonica]|uniref:peroxidase 12 n=1 Tax=Cryptomeria japonica TaxID=3369 RepID=UPI0027DA6B95|nr:peroxidase 12 [Cryptomeria japonica]